jgi:hypothetical protein
MSGVVSAAHRPPRSHLIRHPTHRRIELARANDPRPWTHRLAQVIAEVLAGARSPGQLSTVATLDVVRLLERRYGRFRATRDAPPVRPIVRSVHLSEPLDGVVEACAVVATGHRVRAFALRLEQIDERWRCTALQVG